MITTYAKVVGSFLAGLGCLGLATTHHHILGLHFDAAISLIFLSTGVMLVGAGFAGRWTQTRRTVLLSSAIYGLLAITGFLSTTHSLQYSSDELLYLSLSVSALMFGLPETYAFKH